jgi:hypothetical protein
VVEHRLAKARVASSSLVSRSRSKAKVKSKKDKREHVLTFSFYLLPFYLSPIAELVLVRFFRALMMRPTLVEASSGRRSQVVRQRSAKPLFIGSIPIAASNKIKSLRAEI